MRRGIPLPKHTVVNHFGILWARRCSRCQTLTTRIQIPAVENRPMTRINAPSHTGCTTIARNKRPRNRTASTHAIILHLIHSRGGMPRSDPDGSAIRTRNRARMQDPLHLLAELFLRGPRTHFPSGSLVVGPIPAPQRLLSPLQIGRSGKTWRPSRPSSR